MSDDHNISIEEQLLALGVEVRDLKKDAISTLQAAINLKDSVQELIVSHQVDYKANQKAIGEIIEAVPVQVRASINASVEDVIADTLKGLRGGAKEGKEAIQDIRDESIKTIRLFRAAGEEIAQLIKRRNLAQYLTIIAVSIICLIGIHFYYQQQVNELNIIRAERAKMGEHGIDVHLDSGTNGLWIVLPRGAKATKSRDFSEGRQGIKVER